MLDSDAAPISPSRAFVPLDKSPTGIEGFDAVTGGGLPTGRPSLVCGDAGAGKSLFALQFLVNGAQAFDEPGVCLAFEESREDIVANVRSLGFDLDRLEREGKIVIDAIRLEPENIIETGEFDLEALMVRLAWAVQKVGAKRVIIDTVEALFGAFGDNPALIRSELRRLFRWLKAQGLTTVITGERGDGHMTRHGIEEYVSDCVVLLDHRVVDEISTRRLRVTKYRGSSHGVNEYPFLIGDRGLEVLPLSTVGLQHQVTDERFATGVSGLDEMLGGKGLYRGSSVLISGTSGTCKTTLASTITDAACRRGETVLYFGFEESQAQVIRNMRSVGLDLETWTDAGLLHYHCQRPTSVGLETHLALMRQQIGQLSPHLVVIDPVSSLARSGTALDVNSMLVRQIDFLKTAGITAVLTALVEHSDVERTNQDISSLVDTWLLVENLEGNGERNRGLYVLKSRGMPHSNQIREFLLGEDGISLVHPYLGPGGVLTGSARATQEAAEATALAQSQAEAVDRSAALARRRKVIEAQVAALWAAYEDEAEQVERHGARVQRLGEVTAQRRREMAELRGMRTEVAP